MPTVGNVGPTSETPSGWGVLLAIADGWGITLRVAFLMFIPITATVALAIYLGPVGIAALASLACGEGVRRVINQRKHRRGTAHRR